MELDLISPHPLVNDLESELSKIEKQVSNILQDNNFAGLYFTDGYQGEILVNAKHKKVIGKKFIGYFSLKADLSNKSQVIMAIVSTWKKQANGQEVKYFNNFVKQMDKDVR